MAELPASVSKLAEHDREFLNALAGTAAETFTPGAHELKYKYLLAMALDAQANHPGGVKLCVRRTREAGATEREIIEVLRVVFYLSGMQALVVGANALEQ